MPGPYPEDMTEAERDLDRALCNFCNQASDPFEPASLWDEFVRRDLSKLCSAYNKWYVELTTRHRSEPISLPADAQEKR